jgi:ribosomal protein S27AE
MKKEICPLCGKEVNYNFCSDRWECKECNFSDLYCLKDRKKYSERK